MSRRCSSCSAGFHLHSTNGVVGVVAKNMSPQIAFCLWCVQHTCGDTEKAKALASLAKVPHMAHCSYAHIK